MFLTQLFLLFGTAALMVSYGGEAKPGFGEDFKVAVPLTEPPPKVERPPPPGAPKERRKRSTCSHPASELTELQKNQSRDYHNELREAAGFYNTSTSADEVKLQWDDDLAALAQTLVNDCKFDHNHLYLCNGENVGQNLAITTATNQPPSFYIGKWYDEVHYYSFDTGECTITDTNKACGHYTQLVWHRTEKVGCAQKTCASVPMGPTNWTDATIFACNYYPAGNVNGAQPYLPGLPCTECDNIFKNNTYACENDLCVGCTKETNSNCQCNENACENGGTFNSTTCSCTGCNTGYCGILCSNKDDYPSENCAYWKSVGYCQQSSPYYSFMKTYCKCTCGF